MGATKVLSPLAWVGGKHAAAARILAAFPPPDMYESYVEVFGGAAHVLLRKPPGKQLEVYNDRNSDLVRFWMAARDQPEALQARIDSLPYSRTLFYQYRHRLQQKEPLDDLERAACWFYMLRSVYGGYPDGSKGWGYVITKNGKSNAHALRSVTAVFPQVAQRFRYVQIECLDFAQLITTYETPRTLFYVDPPYMGTEDCYNTEDAPFFTSDDHARLATALNATPALVALSYYEHPLLDDLYPASRWRRMTWTQPKAVEKTKQGSPRKPGREVLLMNYPETFGGLLWHYNTTVV